MLDDAPFLAGVRQILQTCDLSGFNPGGHAPMNAAKKPVLVPSRSLATAPSSASANLKKKRLKTLRNYFQKGIIKNRGNWYNIYRFLRFWLSIASIY